ncbi:hypothetical protein [Virgibacillus sp. YIM 98842]|uniref:hypothetical protein n=1 Tax=Virgibacillus sp. YIM 98842 TaxID=2663533 RepID=UPI0013DC3B88|nr:hypothetical protein [Virgibacillus sp. YIM 98842]
MEKGKTTSDRQIGEITNQFAKFITYFGYLEKQASQIQSSSESIDVSVDHFA